VFTPVHAIAYRERASVIGRRAWERFYREFHPRREVATTLGISALLHLGLLLIIGSSIYDEGEDDRDVPELSVQLETREGPNDEEFTEAALPQPAPDPVEDVLDDPGTGEQSIDAPMVADATPLQAAAPDQTIAEISEAHAETPADTSAILTTTASSSESVAMVPEPGPSAPVADIPQVEQVILTRNVQQIAQTLLDSDQTDTEITWQQNGQQYSARVMRQPASDSTGIEQVVAEIMTDKAGKRMKTRLSLKRLAFSHFTQLVNNWDRNIQLHDDVIDGRFHSNTEFAFTASGGVTPRFFGKVTTAAATVSFNGINRRRNQEIFQGGFESRTERVNLPRDMPDLTSGGEDTDRRVFADDTRIIFNADGSYVWRRANGEGPLEREPPNKQPRYLIGEKGAKLYVRGTVSGLFTVYSPNDIEIEDDLTYARDPRQSVLSQDFLALVSGRDVCIAGPEVTGPGDLTVHGAIFARRRFYIESTDRGGGDGATLLIYGSVTAGTLSETEPRYATKYDFDKRFEYLRPASFPMTRRYEVDSWNEDWEEVENAENPLPSGNLAQSQ
jgi:hypothetical protein